MSIHVPNSNYLLLSEKSNKTFCFCKNEKCSLKSAGCRQNFCTRYCPLFVIVCAYCARVCSRGVLLKRGNFLQKAGEGRHWKFCGSWPNSEIPETPNSVRSTNTREVIKKIATESVLGGFHFPSTSSRRLS